MNNKKILNDYYEAKLALDILTKEVEGLKKGVIEVLQGCPENKTAIQGAKFSLRSYKSYKYSDELESKRKQLAVDQKLEVETGVAEVVRETFSPVMTKTK